MDKLVEKCKAVVAAFPEIELAYWFGSRAKGKGTPLSDWDFAVNYNKDMTWKEQLNIRSTFADSLETDAIDLVDWDQAPPPLRYAVVQEGIVLWQIIREELGDIERCARNLAKYAQNH